MATAGESARRGYFMAEIGAMAAMNPSSSSAPRSGTLPAATVGSDPAALLERHRSQLSRLVRRLADPADRDDVVQDVALAALERPPRASMAMPAWLAATVRNVVAKRLRSLTRRRAREQQSAVPERLPSTAELCARVELEEFLLRAVRELADPERAVVLLRFFEGKSAVEIARALGLGESTVRARLQRALERLRGRLDSQMGGTRHGWIALLAPWSLPGAATTGAAGGLAAGTLVGVTVWASKKVVAIAASLLVTVSLLTIAVVEQRAARSTAAPFTVSSAAEGANARAGVADAPLPEPVSVERSAARPPAELTDGDGSPAGGSLAVVPAKVPSVAPSGTLALSAVDAATGARLTRYDVRGLQEGERFIAENAVGAVALKLTPGRWSLLIRADGYEPRLIEDVVIERGMTRDLHAIALGRGTGVIEGRVERRGFDATATATTPGFVELRGDGRSPCPLCAMGSPAALAALASSVTLDDLNEAPPVESYTPPITRCCGWFWDRSLLPVGPDGTFRFTGLGAGCYFVRALDDQPRLMPTQRLLLASGERRVIDLVLAPEASVQFELVDERGAPFVGSWKDDYDEETTPIHFDLEFEQTTTTIDAGVEPADVRSRFGPPPRLGQPLPSEGAVNSANGDTAGTAAAAPASADGNDRASARRHLNALLGGRIDVPRRPTDELMPVPETPGFAAVEIGIARLEANCFLIVRMPSAPCRFTIRCADYRSEPITLDLADPNQHSARVVLRPGR